MFELLGRGINLNAPLDTDGKTALHYSAMRRGCGGCPDPKQKRASTFEIAVAAETVEEGATPEPSPSPEPIGAPCSQCGCVMPKPETATQILLEHGASDRCGTNESGWLPLHLACIEGHTETVRTLLQWDTTTAKAKDHMLRTAAHLQGSADGEILAMLRHVGADFYAQDERLQTPLHAAVFAGLKAGVNFLSLDIALPQSRRSQRMGIVKPADPFGVVDEDGSAALHLAVSENHFMIVKFLVISDEKAMDREDSRGRTPLELAEVALRGVPGSKILAYLRNAELERREEIDIDPDKYPLHSFALEGSLDELRATMGSRLQFLFGSRDEKGYTPLHYAAWAGHVKCVKWLQNRQGVETEDETDVYENAIEIAARNRHQPVVDFLQYGLEAEEEQELAEESDESEEEEVDPDLDYTNDDCTVKRESETQAQYLERLYTLYMLMLPPLENAADALKLVGGKVPEDATVRQRVADIQVRTESISEISLLQQSLDARLFDMQEKYKGEHARVREAELATGARACVRERQRDERQRAQSAHAREREHRDMDGDILRLIAFRRGALKLPALVSVRLNVHLCYYYYYRLVAPL